MTVACTATNYSGLKNGLFCVAEPPDGFLDDVQVFDEILSSDNRAAEG